jgi:hypothetical protein
MSSIIDTLVPGRRKDLLDTLRIATIRANKGDI